MYLSRIHSFRAIAILVIVAGHVPHALSFEDGSVAFKIADQALANATVLFVFIAGYLFEHLSAKFQFPKYLRRKAQTVMLPYLVCSIPAIAFAVLINEQVERYPFLLEWSIPRKVIWYYLVGGAHLNNPLWYLPMIALIFLAAPLFIQFKRHPRLYWLLVILIPFSIFAHRPGTEAFYLGYALENAIYFAPVYVLGMCVSANRERIEPYLPKLLPWLFGAYLLVAFLQFHFQQHVGIYGGEHLFSQEKGLLGWPLIRMLVSCFLVLSATQVWEKQLEKPLSFIGTVSFSIYFLHYYIMVLVKNYYGWEDVQGTVLNVSVIFFLTLSVPCAIAFFSRKIFGKRSRFLIGS